MGQFNNLRHDLLTRSFGTPFVFAHNLVTCTSTANTDRH